MSIGLGVAAALAGNPTVPTQTGSRTSAIPFWDEGTTSAGAFAGGEGPTFSDNPWDVVFVNGLKLPGICSVKVKPQFQIDQQKGPKHDGAKIVLHGYYPGPVLISTKLWTKPQWDEYVSLREVFWRKPTKDDPRVQAIAASRHISVRDAQLYVSSVAVGHPVFSLWGIKAVLVRGVSEPEDGPEPQAKIIKLDCIEYSPPESKTAPSRVSANVPLDVRRQANPTTSPPSQTDVGPGGPGT